MDSWARMGRRRSGRIGKEEDEGRKSTVMMRWRNSNYNMIYSKMLYSNLAWQIWTALRKYVSSETHIDAFKK